MGQLEVGVNFFIALFALIDPIGNVPLFAAATASAPAAARRRIALYISLFAAAFLVFFYFTGTAILRFFSISMPAFHLAGGILLLLLGLDMSRESHAMGGSDLISAEEAARLDAGDYAKLHFERLIVPFGMPLLIGPGAISTVIIYAADAEGVVGAVTGVGAILAVSGSILLSFLLSGVLTRVLGKTGMVIVIRVLGLILCAMAVQFILVGLSGATVGFIRGSAVHPWQGR